MNNIATFFRESRIGRFFIPLGIILIIFSIFLFIIDKQNKDYIETIATVSNVELVEESYTDVDGNLVEATYKVFVKYTVNEKEYNEELGELSGYKKGDKIKIVYNPKDPSQISQPSSIYLAIGMLIAGIASLVGGIISIIIMIKNHKELKEQEKSWNNG